MVPIADQNPQNRAKSGGAEEGGARTLPLINRRAHQIRPALNPALKPHQRQISQPRLKRLVFVKPEKFAENPGSGGAGDRAAPQRPRR
jgi:hypothetical protein